MTVEFLRLDYSPCPPDEAPARFGFECPRRPGEMCSGLLIAGADLGGGWVMRRGHGMQCWDWDGNRERPTFAPSINCGRMVNGQPAGGCGWHGFIQNGVLAPC